MSKRSIIKSITSSKTLANVLQKVADKKNEIILQIYAKPGAKRNKVTDISVEFIGIQLAAQPRDGKANDELLLYISELFNIKKSDICMVRGGTSRVKTIKVSTDKSEDDIRSLLESEIKS
ncbi:UPF0235 protein C15orf40 homolog [Hydra vulgaris]|uniref:UPF0235 protein C15orf40 homolog n=1 Tax=Hydra vulgaris TaxID=6087 RepID=A0ABM4D9F1_HYDVU